MIMILLVSITYTVSAQNLYVGDGAVFYLEGGDFKGGTNPVTHHVNGAFKEKAGVNWSTASDYVNGKIAVIGAGTTTVNVGDTAQSTISITTLATDEILCDYTKSAPAGTMDSSIASYLLSDAEYWTVLKTVGTSTDVSVSSLTNTATTYGGEAPVGTPILVRRDNSSSSWVKYADNIGFGEFAYASETSSTLSVSLVDLASFALYPNPVKSNISKIQFRLPNNIEQLDITLYDIIGKEIRVYTNLPVDTHSINKPNVNRGIYFIKFSVNNGTQFITKRIILE